MVKYVQLFIKYFLWKVKSNNNIGVNKCHMNLQGWKCL